MLPLYRDPYFTFQFAEDRIIPRFQLEGIKPGTPVSVFVRDPASGEPRDRIRVAVASEGGWVEMDEPIVVRAGGGFVVIPGEGNQ